MGREFNGASAHAELGQKASGKVGIALTAAMAACYLIYAALLLLALHRGAQSAELSALSGFPSAQGASAAAQQAALTGKTVQEAGIRGMLESAVFFLFTIECWRAWFLEMQNDLGRFCGKMARLILLIAVLGAVCAALGRLLAPEFPGFWSFLEPVPVLVLCFFVNLAIAAIFAHNRKRMDRRRR